MRPDIVPGAAFPDFELSDQKGRFFPYGKTQAQMLAEQD
jgi:hypothetical protein